MFYTLAYVIMAAGAFGMILLLSRAGLRGRGARRLQGPERSAARGSPDHADADVQHGRRAAVGRLLRQAGRLQAAVDAGFTVAGADRAVLFSVIGAFYYLRVVKLMYFDEQRKSTSAVTAGRHGHARLC